jgi:hypothetical protein
MCCHPVHPGRAVSWLPLNPTPARFRSRCHTLLPTRTRVPRRSSNPSTKYGKDFWHRHFSFVICAPPLLYFTLSEIVIWQFGSNRGRHRCALRAFSFPLRIFATCNLQPACCRIEAILQRWWGPQDPGFGCKFICHLQQVCCRFDGAKNAKGKVPPASPPQRCARNPCHTHLPAVIASAIGQTLSYCHNNCAG